MKQSSYLMKSPKIFCLSTMPSIVLLTQIMAKDPPLALQKAEGMLDRGEYSLVIVSVLELLQDKDKAGAA